jgi:hypothetical protein
VATLNLGAFAMPKLPNPRTGHELQINAQAPRFSRWPVRQKGKSYALQTELLTKNPWEVIENSINAALDRRSRAADVCLAFLFQSLDFYRAYEGSRVSSRPLLLYYSFLNLVKALVVCRQPGADLAGAAHGLTENRTRYTRAVITAKADRGRGREIYDMFAQKLGEAPLTAECNFDLSKTLLSQIVIGHRLWAQAANQRERFVRVQAFKYLQSAADQSVWLSFDVTKSDLDNIGVTPGRFLRNARLMDFRQVKPAENDDDRLVHFEQTQPRAYSTHPGEALGQLSHVMCKHVWCVIRTVPPYRRYYLWGGDSSIDLLNPLLSVYLVLFYLGSVTRYRPYYFEELQVSPFGNFFDEIVQTQGQQLLYHLAAEFSQRDVSWPAVL